MITANHIKQVLDYNPLTGIFYTKVKTKHHEVGDEVGYITGKGYIRISIPGMKGLQHQAHRLAALIMEGEWPDQVDHINGVKTDNRWVNLRSVGALLNSRNTKKRKDNTSGCTGVYFRKDNGKWRVIVSGINLGQYKSYEQACQVRKEKALSYGYTTRHGSEDVLYN